MTEQPDNVESEHAATTGDSRVDAVVARLDDLEPLDLPAQLAVFTELQESLAEVLDDSAAPSSTVDQPTPS